jgi:hypothetical protein
MLARRSKLVNKASIAVDLPRLVPSFSSKGFPVVSKGNGRYRSEVSNALALMGPYLKQSLLVSAYDICHDLLQGTESFIGNAELVFLDSGAYELSEEYDSTEPKQFPYAPLKFPLSAYKKVLSNLPRGAQIVISNYDWGTKRKPLSEQIDAGRRLFNKYSQFLSNFIVKPGTARLLDIDEVIRHLKHMRKFDVIGVTEKELGDNLIDRLRGIAKLRAAMNRENIEAPLHIWGGLDPVITPLYFFVGAEVFDGVSWLRYAYHRGAAVYRDSYGVLHPQLGVMQSRDHTQSLTLSHNVSFLDSLTTSLRRFVDANCQDFSMFEDNRDAFERAYKTLASEIPEMRRTI